MINPFQRENLIAALAALSILTLGCAAQLKGAQVAVGDATARETEQERVVEGGAMSDTFASVLAPFTEAASGLADLLSF